MDVNTALRATESKRGQAESGDVKTSADELAALLRGVSEAPAHEIEKLINQLQRLRTQLHNVGNRIQRDIGQYGELNQQTIQLTAIISDGVKNLPGGTKLARLNEDKMAARIHEGVMEQLKRQRCGRPGSS
jgi:predicted transcriptional regulator